MLKWERYLQFFPKALISLTYKEHLKRDKIQLPKKENGLEV